MNTADAERISSVLDSLGLTRCNSEKEADIIIILACSVRQKAVDRIFGKINKWQKEKKKRNLITILTGCVLEHDKNKLKDRFDLIFHIEELNKLPALLKPYLPVKRSDKFPSDYLCLPPSPFSSFVANIPIMTGCDNYCTYCAVPYTRGRERSRLQKEIINEIKTYIKKGFKEIVLLGQNVNSYGHTKSQLDKDNKPFINLLKAVDNIPGKFWVHFISNHPKDMTYDLVKTVSNLKKVCPYIHLPLQSGDNQIIKKMNRHYTIENYIKLVKFIKKEIPGVAITTDIIVGFPEETKKQFNNSLAVAKTCQYDMAYLAQYSQRPGTVASKLEDNVPKKEKVRREEELTEIIRESVYKNNQKLIGTVQEVLVDGKKGQYFYGRTKTRKVVKFEDNQDHTGQFIKIKIKQAEPWKLLGEIK